MSPNSEVDTPSKTGKRAASRQMTSDASKKQRGRPRVAPTPEDGTAADRRRTQIRLAQRAYRQRKETTITSCKHQVADLQKVIEDMNATFVKFSSEVLRDGVVSTNYNLRREFEMTAQRMDLLVRKAEDVTSEAMKDDDKSSESHSVGEIANSENDNLTTTTLDWNETNLKPKQSSPASSDATPTTVWGYSVVYEPESKPGILRPLPHQGVEKYSVVADLFNPRLEVFNPNPERPRDSQEYAQQIFSSQPELYSQLAPQTFMTMSLPSPSTYSFNEVSFARRLHRACLEDVFSLLSSPGISPNAVWNKFKFSLAHSNLQEIRERIKIRLSKTAFEPLESPYSKKQIPLGQGRAQTNNAHYPHSDKTFPNMGHQKHQVPNSDAVEEDGGWLSPEEVQKFVEAKGVFFNSSVSFAEGEIIDAVPGQYAEDIGVEASFLQSPPKTPDFIVKDVTLFNGYNNDKEIGLSNMDQTHPIDLAQTDGLISHTNSSGNMQVLGMFQRPALVRKRVVLDLVKFLSELVAASVCRGRIPKLRQEDVERAFRMSTVPI